LLAGEMETYEITGDLRDPGAQKVLHFEDLFCWSVRGTKRKMEAVLSSLLVDSFMRMTRL